MALKIAEQFFAPRSFSEVRLIVKAKTLAPTYTECVSPKTIFIILIAAGAVLEVAGDVVLKHWSLTNKTALVIFGLALYFAGSVFWAYSLWYESLSRAIVVFTLFNLVLAVLLGLILFNETLTPRQLAGVGLAILAIILVEM